MTDLAPTQFPGRDDIAGPDVISEVKGQALNARRYQGIYQALVSRADASRYSAAA